MPATTRRQKKFYTDPNNQNSSPNKSSETSATQTPSKQRSVTRFSNGLKPSKPGKAHFDREEMEKYVLWRRPFTTASLFILELFQILFDYFRQMLKYRVTLVVALLLAGLVVLGFQVEGNHQALLHSMKSKLLWYAYWLGLGIASSIGLGTGLHTFLLYLGPFIAQVRVYEIDTQKNGVFTQTLYIFLKQ